MTLGSAISSAGPIPIPRVDPLISMIAPTFEVHVNDPLNHRDHSTPATPPDGRHRRPDLWPQRRHLRPQTLLTFAIVTPVTSPKPFDFESMAFLNVYFGRPTATTARLRPCVGGF